MEETKNKIEQKRVNCKDRTRKSRDRKKMYIEDLENKVKTLEKENFRLHHLLLYYRKESMRHVDEEPVHLVEDIDKYRQEVESTFIDNETGGYNERARVKCSEHFSRTSKRIMESHKKVMNLGFDLIIDHLHPFVSFFYWKNFDQGYSASYELIKKYGKRTKFEKPEFIKNNNLTELDLLIASFDPNKRQYDFLTTCMFPKERQIKSKFDDALSHLIKSKEMIAEANAELHAFRTLFIKSEIISDKQVFSSNLNFEYKGAADLKLKSIWDIEVIPKVININLEEDFLYGKYAKRLLEKRDRFLQYEYESYSADKDVIKLI
ncbi:unnamed protein product [Moneuplotes crassus]|uniref:BZIP domain-containing protein n=2 Tax=Euplotes crassus TaxID=5936 RepID=A0AAD2D042_EUPCR|nr:unnamed protein product [Moneuplotes crassus]